MAQLDAFPKRWHCTYWFPSNNHDGEEPSEYDMHGYREGEVFILESEPEESGAYMFIRLRLEIDDIITGNWHETTSPTGEFKGARYSGAGQLIQDPETLRMEGKWAGAGYDHYKEAMQVYTGNWEIKPI